MSKGFRLSPWGNRGGILFDALRLRVYRTANIEFALYNTCESQSQKGPGDRGELLACNKCAPAAPVTVAVVFSIVLTRERMTQRRETVRTGHTIQYVRPPLRVTKNCRPPFSFLCPPPYFLSICHNFKLTIQATTGSTDPVPSNGAVTIEP
jgi:hypothetical protein